MQPLIIRNCLTILVITARESSLRQGPVMLKQLITIASQRIGSRDFWRICNSVLNRGKSTIPPLFNGPEVLTTSTDKANLFARNFSYNSTLDDSYQLLPDFPSRTEHRLTSRKITARMVSHAIYHLDTCKATGPDRIPSIVLKMCSPELSPVLAKLYNKCLAKSCFPSCWKSSGGAGF